MTKQRMENLFKKLSEKKIDSVFITSKANVFYFSNYYTDPHERLVGVYASEGISPLLIVPSMEVEDARQAGWESEIIHYGDHENIWEKLYHYLEAKKALPNHLGLEYNHLNLERYKTLKNLFPETTISDLQDDLAQLRLIKNREEYLLLKEAADLADYGIQVGKSAISEGATELEIVAEIEYALKKKGVQEMSFSTTVLTGNKTASPHGVPSSDQVQKGDFVLFDLGVVHEGYCSDITRTFAFESLSKKQEEIYNTVLKAEKQAIQASQLGVAVGQVDKVARDLIEEAGYGKYFTHRIGHGLGIDVHEYPSMHQDNKLALQEGMCFTIEPGIYIPEIGGVRIEDMIFMKAEGPESLTSFNKELQIIQRK